MSGGGNREEFGDSFDDAQKHDLEIVREQVHRKRISRLAGKANQNRTGSTSDYGGWAAWELA